MQSDDPNVREELLMPSTIEDIDAAMLDYINNTLNISTETNKGFEKVPVIWVAAERAAQIKQIKDLLVSSLQSFTKVSITLIFSLCQLS